MLARVKIILQRLENVLLVPQAAVRTVGKRQFVEYNDEINGVTGQTLAQRRAGGCPVAVRPRLKRVWKRVWLSWPGPSRPSRPGRRHRSVCH